MTYATYYINPQSLSVNIRDFYQKYDTAVKRLKPDVEEFVKSTKNTEKVEYINKKIDISSKDNGYYLKMSTKYPNRVTVYESTTKDVGYWISNIVTEVKKIYVFSLLELSSVPDDLNIDIQKIDTNKKLKPISSLTPEVMMELMDRIEKLKKE